MAEAEDPPAEPNAAPNNLAGLGPPSEPLPFPQPQFYRGRRDTVLVYDPDVSKNEYQAVQNVLFRDFSRGGVEASTTRTRYAYWPNPYRHPIETIMGHVEICRVLEARSTTQDSEEEEEDEIIFQWTSRRVAVKVNYADRMERMRGRHAENPEQEIAAMQLLGEEPVHVLGALEVLFDGQNLNIVLPFCENGDLFELMQGQENRADHPPDVPGFTEGEARFWFRQIMAGVAFVHSKGICHRDLSPENVMIDGGEMFIIDMGMCLRVPYLDPKDRDARTDIVGANGQTPRCLFKPQGPFGKLPYMSPEIYSSRRPFDGSAADVWTSGTILFCMITGNQSYRRPHRSDLQFFFMTQGLRQLLTDWNVNFSEAGINLLEGMLQTDPRRRLTLEEVRRHPWFDGADEPPAGPLE